MLKSVRTNSYFFIVILKAYVRQLYLQGLIILIKKLSPSCDGNENGKISCLFKTEIVATIGDDLKSVFESEGSGDGLVKNKENFNLLMACLNSHHADTTEFLKSHSLKPKLLFTGDYATSIFEILSQSSESLPTVQPLCTEMFAYLVRHQPKVFASVWPQVVDVRLASKKEPEKKLLAVKFFFICLELVSSSNDACYSTLIESSEHVLQTFVGNYSNRQSNLSDLMRDEMTKSLVEIVRTKESDEMALGADLVIKLVYIYK